MTSNQESEFWYGNRKEPYLTLRILKEIALNGKQTTSDLSHKLDSKYTTIDKTLSRDADKKSRGMFRRNGKKSTGKIKVSYFSLTEHGIDILISGHYKSTGKPYLNQKELYRFYDIFDSKHRYEKIKDKSKGIYLTTYLVSHSLIRDKLIDEFRNNEKVKILISELENIKQKLNQLTDDEDSKKEDLRLALAFLFVSSFKK